MTEEDIYECEHCNEEFTESEILYRQYGGETGTLTFCPRCKQATKLIYVSDVSDMMTIDPIQQAILDSWKRQGGIYKQAAEAVEHDLECEKFDAVKCSTSPSPTNTEAAQ